MNKKADKGGEEYKKPNIPDKFLKAYDPAATEERIYKMWEESGYFDPDRLPGDRKEIFTVMLPPPNATGILHLGHALEDSLQDVAVRYARMRGKKALWVPGTDHAAIATNTKVEKEMIKAEGKNRHDIGRDAFIKRVEEFVVGSRGTIQKQIRRMGASCDWSREAFTFDEARSNAVNEAFRKMYEAGLIYRGLRVVNWDPKGQTTVSDDEVQHKAEKGMLYTFRYSNNFPIPIATTRPETKVGDTAVAVNPEDSRYKSFIGKEFKDIDFAGARLNIKVIADAGVDPAYGTGAVGVTPAHSMVDAEMAERHGLDFIQVIDEHARMNDNAGVLVGGKKTKEARQLIVDWLKENSLLEKEESIDMNVSVADRSGGVIEPLPKKQWFVNVNKPIAERGGKTLKQLMSEPVEKGEIKIMPERFEKIYFHWINNLRDWCISRQLWYGHRVPVWYNGDITSIGPDMPDGKGWVRDEDTLDTWFSSALWTFSTLGWPGDTDDLRRFHPTDLMAPGYEILFFWVARMILMSQFLLGQVPFRVVYLHGILRDKQGRKFSKSLGNGVDPIEVIGKYGADALRMSLIVGIGPGNDANFDEQKVKGYKNFSNKLWNITRFVLESTEGEVRDDKFMDYAGADKKIIDENIEMMKDITTDMENYRYYMAAEKLYHYAWHNFADIILEESKAVLKGEDNVAKKSRKQMLLHVLDTIIRALHPFMPYVTEEIWQEMYSGKRMLMVENWVM